jgi:peptidoglycan L-alanyl-D-glutamate endopeptidase CwlK
MVALSAASDARLQNVMPWLADKIHAMADILALDPTPITLVVSAGLRTWLEQDTLYAQGRAFPGKIVTNARGGYSWHNFGLACDCIPEVVDGKVDWNGSHYQWKRMEAVGVSLGLTSGANWLRLVDAPHFQYVSPYSEGVPDDEARQIYLNEGAAAFWATVQT